MSYFTQTGEPKRAKIIFHVLIGLIIFSILLGSFGTIAAGERGVKTRLGKVASVVEPGLYFKIPFIEKMHRMSVKTQTVIYERENPLTGASKDLQDVQIATVVNYHIDPTKIIDIFVQYGTVESFEERAVRPVVRDSVKAIASQYTAEELVTKRAQFSEQALALLNARLVEKSVVVEQGNITNLEFSKSFTEAIEAKVTAVQNAEAQKNKLEQVKYEAQQQIETAKATAEAQRISAAALAAQGGADYVQLKAIEKWNGVLPTQMIPGSTVPFLNLNN